MEPTIPSKNNQNIESNDIIIDIPFIAAQVISITANQSGRSFFQVVAINIFLLLAAKMIFVLIKKFKE